MLIFLKFAVTWEEKYGNRPRNENYSETYLFQLSVERKDRPFASHLLARQYPASLMVTETDLLPSN